MSVTIKQIAEEAGLSWPAVSQILKAGGRFAPATRKRVLAVAAKHNYRPNSSARSLRNQKSKLIGVVFRNAPDQPLTNMTAFEFLLGINQHFQTAEYDTVLVRAGELLNDDSVEPRVFRERLVDGLIVVSSLPNNVLARLKRLTSNIIWLDAPVWQPTCCVRRDEASAGRLAVESLLSLGYRKILFVTREAINAAHHSIFEREAGARAAADVAGAAFKIVSWPEMDAAGRYDLLRQIARPDEGVVAVALPIAKALASNLASLGFVPGRDFGLTCCDDSFETRAGWQNLCRVRFDRFALGEVAAGMMLQLIKNPETPPVSKRIQDDWIIGNTAWGPT